MAFEKRDINKTASFTKSDIVLIEKVATKENGHRSHSQYMYEAVMARIKKDMKELEKEK